MLQWKVLTTINVIAIVLAGTIATQWSTLQNYELNHLLSLKLVTMQVLSINSGKREAVQKLTFDLSADSASLAFISPGTLRGPYLA